MKMNKSEKYQIYVFGRGHVVIAEKIEPVDGWYTLDGGSTIRAWGTQNGLGELAQGPTKETVLDAIPYGIDIPEESIHGIWRVSVDSEQVWAEALKTADEKLLTK
jgi:hypothetical protein